ncbi:MAG: hypothetical protein IT435_02270 [Phycisphaerales bacterium]|nr:hypothetical protein [Phycisphaerales bacterium]
MPFPQFTLPGIEVPNAILAPDGTGQIVSDPIPAPEGEFSDPVQCGCCHAHTEREDSAEAPDGDTYCAECHSENVCVCECCDTEIFNDDSFFASRDSDGRAERTVCEDCSFRCERCEERFYGEGIVEGNSHYCNECHCELYTSCDECGDTIPRDDANYIDDVCLCAGCYRSREREDSDLVNDYNYKPSAIFHRASTDDSDRFFGIELECEYPRGTSREDCTEEIRDVVESHEGRLWYAKHDGSLDNGCEFVSHPGTLSFWREEGFDWTNTLRRANWRSWKTNTCGIHIHVSRNSLTERDWFKLARFFRDSESLIRRMARRDPSRYATVKTGEKDSALMRKVRKSSSRDRDRYQALNFENNRTVEVRIFKGTLDANSVARNLECVNALCEFARTRGMRDMNENGFREWLILSAERFIGESAAQSLRNWLFPSSDTASPSDE